MSAIMTYAHFSCTLEASNTQTLSLTQLVQNQLGQQAMPDEFSFHIIVQPGVHATITDDLVDAAMLKRGQSLHHKLSFSLLQDSQLDYVSIFAPGTEHDVPVFQPMTADNVIIEKTIDLMLDEKYAQARVKYSCFGAGDRVFKFKTLQHHRAPETTSDVSIKGVLDQVSKLVCNSMIKVDKIAQKTYAHQVNKNIVLSKNARVVSVPQLEIEANDVTCKHGAATSRLSAQDLFYLQSRGINARTTRDLLIAAFLQ